MRPDDIMDNDDDWDQPIGDPHPNWADQVQLADINHAGETLPGDSVFSSPEGLSLTIDDMAETLEHNKVEAASWNLRNSNLFNYQEGQILADLIDYIAGTYNQHYAVQKDMQTIDVWEARGTLESTAADTAIKYLMRYGRKEGKNKKDALKAAHYVILMLYASLVEEDVSKSNLRGDD